MMRGGQLLQLLDGNATADHAVVGDHIGRAGAAIEQRHLAESEPWAQGGHAPPAFLLSGSER